MKTDAGIAGFLEQVRQWAVGKPDIAAIALVGSYAYGAATEASDIDLVLLVDDPERYLQDPGWMAQFGAVSRWQMEDYGKVTSLRALYAGGREVEYGITTRDWAARPLDEGTRRVLADGMQVVFEREPLLSAYS